MCLLLFYYSIPNGSHRGSDLSDLSDFDIEELIKMHKLCRQVSIESPGPIVKDCVFSFVVPVPDTPEYGARVKVRNCLIKTYLLFLFFRFIPYALFCGYNLPSEFENKFGFQAGNFVQFAVRNCLP